MNLLLSSLPRIWLLHLPARGSVLGHVEHTHVEYKANKKLESLGVKPRHLK